MYGDLCTELTSVSLVYSNDLPTRLLNYIARASKTRVKSSSYSTNTLKVSFASDNSVHRSETFVSSRIVLLHGPPGSGKTTLW